jgi:hypothetical protein
MEYAVAVTVEKQISFLPQVCQLYLLRLACKILEKLTAFFSLVGFQ